MCRAKENLRLNNYIHVQSTVALKLRINIKKGIWHKENNMKLLHRILDLITVRFEFKIIKEIIELCGIIFLLQEIEDLK